jgi:hypothetical protein
LISGRPFLQAFDTAEIFSAQRRNADFIGISHGGKQKSIELRGRLWHSKALPKRYREKFSA